MSLAKKLNFKPGMKVRVVGKPADVDLGDVETTTASSADAVLVFVKTLAQVDTRCSSAVTAAREDRIAWIAYPKAGQLGTDLNRDVLWRHLQKARVQGVRQVALTEVWSAMRFRPAT